MKENCLSLILLVCALNFGFGQILTESFNNDSAFTKNELFFTDGNDDYFGIYDPTGLSDDFDGSPTPLIGLPVYTGNTDLFLVGEDLDSNGGSATRSLTWSNLNISGYTGLNFSVDLAADTGGFDAADQILFEINIDGSGYTTLIAFSGTGTNTDATNGTITLNTAFQNVTTNIAGTGNLLDLRLTITANADGEEFAVDEIVLDGTPPVPCTHTITSFSPIEGPEGTEVTITGSGYTPTSTVNFNGVAASSIQYINANTLIATVPNGITTGSISVIESACTETGSDFTTIDFSGSCSSPFSDLIISEVYDSNSGSLGYIEIYNGTGATIDLSDYEVDRYATLGGAVTSTYTFPALNINDGQVLVGKVSNDPNAPSITPDFTFGNLSGFNDDDRLELVFSATNTIIDDWHDDTVPGGTGFSYLRNTNITGPNPTYNASEWVGNGTEDTSDLGNYSISIVGNPSVTSQPLATTSCLDYTFSITAMPGNSGTLTYQWRFNDGNTNNWQDVNGALLAPATVAGETTNTLSVSGIDLESYQFYCVVTEDASCSIASNAVKAINTTATWDGTNWVWNNGTAINTIPTINDNVIINGNYDTSTGGFQTSFSACNLTINTTNTLIIGNNTYAEIQNNIVANGDITVLPQGSVVQIDNSATTTGIGIITVQKETTILNGSLEYTYWSSPVSGETIEDSFGVVPASRRYFFNASNFEDLLAEIDNTGIFNSGQDDIDDNANAWQLASGIMSAGVGYAATASPFGPFPAPQQFTFVGPFNNGIYQPTLVNNSGGSYNDWNFIGNPYPSAINTNTFFTVNSGIVDNIYLWSQATAANANAQGNDGQNFSGADYAIISASGVNTAGGSGVIPNNFIPSGQGFFVEALSGTNVTFNNSMRVTGNNDQFFRSSNPTMTNRNVLWLNLNSDNGIFNQIAVAHINGATDGDDGTFYDIKRNASSTLHAKIYSIINENDAEFVIQGKHITSLDLEEVIELGFSTIIDSPTIFTLSIAQFEGDFYTTNEIYLKDNLLNTTHNLKVSDYSFTSDIGEFNDRFEIVFNPETLSSNDNIVNANELSIRELSNGDVKIKITEPHTIEKVEILDILGRQIYNLTGNNSVETYNLSKLSKAAYIAKVTLSNGQIISKKAIKQKKV
jgi:hypothetical protein